MPGRQCVNPQPPHCTSAFALAVPSIYYAAGSRLGVPNQEASLDPQVICEQIYPHLTYESFKGWGHVSFVSPEPIVVIGGYLLRVC